MVTALLSASVLALPASRPGPDLEAVQSCATKSPGAACELSHQTRALEGTCQAREGEALACRPAPPPRPLSRKQTPEE
ncbi:hypothetical protein D187_002851 [Cystobacter fuscus DSM 2262]|uniref:Uncharacterized protein n=1 Tax=Cystobacter fuscus (strain ATCC 25194 / DSM 2262 / NBRC 100088 / M29) TaxID=1242864 RepID=S9P883_CYSF2|nr:hypothetical protein D187_002851 [Cystobacter fuscus DSM 2262]